MGKCVSDKRIRNIWYCMKRRCHHPAPSDFENGIARNYFEKGIQVRPEWRDDLSAFVRWAYSHGYKDDLVIDRINPDGDYEPENCRWITRSENAARIERQGKRYIGGRYPNQHGNYEVWKMGIGNWARVKAVNLTYTEALTVKKALSNKATGKDRWSFRIVKVGRNKHEINEFLSSI